MDAHHIFNSIAALVFVLCLICLAGLAYKKFGNGITIGGLKPARRLAIKEVLNIDAKKKVVLISRDGKEHLLAFSENAIEIIEKDITPQA